ncbi:MAG: chemotaxis protein CheB, partial [Pseudomonadota bacterium]
MPSKKTETVRKNRTTKPKKSVEPTSAEKDISVPETKAPFPIVGIGASAGGLEAFEQFFTHTQPDTGMAFVLIQHLDPKHKSILSELIQRYTRMTVQQVEDGMEVEPNSVYVIPPNRNMALLHGTLHLPEPSEIPGVRTPIDYFFRSLAEDRREESICIVLSGTGTEGAMGLRAVKGEGGMVMVQDPESAKYDG